MILPLHVCLVLYYEKFINGTISFVKPILMATGFWAKHYLCCSCNYLFKLVPWLVWCGRSWFRSSSSSNLDRKLSRYCGFWSWKRWMIFWAVLGAYDEEEQCRGLVWSVSACGQKVQPLTGSVRQPSSASRVSLRAAMSMLYLDSSLATRAVLLSDLPLFSLSIRLRTFQVPIVSFLFFIWVRPHA